MQLLALAANERRQPDAQDLVNALRAQIAAGLPAGLRVHLAGVAAVGGPAEGVRQHRIKVQDLSLVFIIVLLVLIFRSLTLALTTLAPALVSFTSPARWSPRRPSTGSRCRRSPSSC